jgi:membrane protease subunit HflC
VIGRYDFDQLVNTIPEKMQLDQVISELRSGIASFAETEYGLRIETVGIKSLGIPEKTSENVFERMINERKVVAERYRQEGKRISEQIKAEADKQRELLLADAEAKSKRIRAEGDAEAASHYAAFRKDPQLAAFLRKLDALRKIMSTRTTLILDTDSVPFDLFKMNPGQTSESQTHKKGD